MKGAEAPFVAGEARESSVGFIASNRPLIHFLENRFEGENRETGMIHYLSGFNRLDLKLRIDA